jgi:two-component system, NarL family, response regulator DegU
VTLRLVLVDDHRMLREGLRRSLEDEGLEVVAEAGDGEEAVRVAGDVEADVILMDVSMPVLDGVEATRRIVTADPEKRVVMLTMHADEEVVQQALRAGAVGYLTKDCSTDEVVNAIRLAANGETVLSVDLAKSMLAEVRRLDPADAREEDRIISKREEEVLQLIADGCSPPEVAAKLFISQKTVKNHLASIYEKLDARDRTQAVLMAVRMGIVKLN